MTNIHMRIKVKGHVSKIKTFNQFMRTLDFDFPFGNGKLPPDITRTYEQCEKCDGLIWNKAMLTQGDLKKAGMQCGVTVKIIRFTEDEACKANNVS